MNRKHTHTIHLLCTGKSESPESNAGENEESTKSKSVEFPDTCEFSCAPGGLCRVDWATKDNKDPEDPYGSGTGTCKPFR